ncbi:MAG: polysaccharide deacetylase family protein [Ruminococcaceae bacterium]|nr:polysaccharide deacetylase family protein [Oscillospiraceae bacterium]
MRNKRLLTLLLILSTIMCNTAAQASVLPYHNIIPIQTSTHSNNVLILMYHLISDVPSHWSDFCISSAELEADVKLLSEKGYRFCTVSELATVSNDEKIAVITVDDGYKSDYTKILPIIKKYNAKATFFVFGGALNTPEYMSSAELLALSSNSCVEIGNHSYLLHENTIPQIRALYEDTANADSIVEDFMKNKAILESIIGKEVTSLSYPNGFHNSVVDQKLKNNGVVTTLLTQERYESVANVRQPLGRFNRGRNTVLANLVK